MPDPKLPNRIRCMEYRLGTITIKTADGLRNIPCIRLRDARDLDYVLENRRRVTDV